MTRRFKKPSQIKRSYNNGVLLNDIVYKRDFLKVLLVSYLCYEYYSILLADYRMQAVLNCAIIARKTIKRHEHNKPHVSANCRATQTDVGIPSNLLHLIFNHFALFLFHFILFIYC